MNIHQKIKAIRTLRGISQKKLAEFAGIENYQAVQQWESGSSKPAISNLANVADCLGTTVDYLVRDDDAPFPDPIQKGAEARNQSLITAEWSPNIGAKPLGGVTEAPKNWDRLADDERVALQSLIDSVLSGIVALPNTKPRNSRALDEPLGRLNP